VCILFGNKKAEWYEKSRRRELNPQPQLYESCALPLSYVGVKDNYLTVLQVSCKAEIGRFYIELRAK
jgi:hypothetical protein